ncbi:MAG TPA: SRPBCC family protein [Nitrososphaeraceae archaeon]|nr:SRPBCC family protein [Nitrososphaeraceae archaeon]
MLEFNNKLEIRRPIAEVFQFLSNFENMPKWNYFVVNVKKISDGPVGINTAFRQKRKTDSQEYKIVEYEPNKKVAIEFQPPSVKLTMRFTLKSSHNDNDTVVVDEWKFDTGIPALFARISITNVKAAVAENLEKLKQLLETGKTILQDGREEKVVL